MAKNKKSFRKLCFLSKLTIIKRFGLNLTKGKEIFLFTKGSQEKVIFSRYGFLFVGCMRFLKKRFLKEIFGCQVFNNSLLRLQMLLFVLVSKRSIFGLLTKGLFRSKLKAGLKENSVDYLEMRKALGKLPLSL